MKTEIMLSLYVDETDSTNKNPYKNHSCGYFVGAIDKELSKFTVHNITNPFMIKYRNSYN